MWCVKASCGNMKVRGFLRNRSNISPILTNKKQGVVNKKKKQNASLNQTMAPFVFSLWGSMFVFKYLIYFELVNSLKICVFPLFFFVMTAITLRNQRELVRNPRSTSQIKYVMCILSKNALTSTLHTSHPAFGGFIINDLWMNNAFSFHPLQWNKTLWCVTMSTELKTTACLWTMDLLSSPCNPHLKSLSLAINIPHTCLPPLSGTTFFCHLHSDHLLACSISCLKERQSINQQIVHYLCN